jgi:DNA-binding transcriptional LysR family regulator
MVRHVSKPQAPHGEASSLGKPTMELHQITYFVALCRELNFTRAAKRCGVSQPSLTRAIKRLETDLNGPLFHRVPRPRLTDRGEAVRPFLEAILRHAEDAKRCASALDDRGVAVGMLEHRSNGAPALSPGSWEPVS